MDERLKEMIAIGASVTANCIPCIRYHLAKALEVGVSEREIMAAIQVGRMVRKGAAQKWDEETGTFLSASLGKEDSGSGC